MISKNELLKLIKEVKQELNEATPAPAGSQGKPTPAANQQPPAPAAKPAQPAQQATNVAFPPAGIPAMQGFADMLFASKHPQYATLKPWLQSLGVRVK